MQPVWGSPEVTICRSRAARGHAFVDTNSEVNNSATITPAMAQRMETWPGDRLVPYARNAGQHQHPVAIPASSYTQAGFDWGFAGRRGDRRSR